jgi:hypothetical protein
MYTVWGPITARLGDQLWILRGLGVPVLLRDTGSAFTFISEAPLYKQLKTGLYIVKPEAYEEGRCKITTRLQQPPVRLRLI